jgi:hypothetical protein
VTEPADNLLVSVLTSIVLHGGQYITVCGSYRCPVLVGTSVEYLLVHRSAVVFGAGPGTDVDVHRSRVVSDSLRIHCHVLIPMVRYSTVQCRTNTVAVYSIPRTSLVREIRFCFCAGANQCARTGTDFPFPISGNVDVTTADRFCCDSRPLEHYYHCKLWSYCSTV